MVQVSLDPMGVICWKHIWGVLWPWEGFFPFGKYLVLDKTNLHESVNFKVLREEEGWRQVSAYDFESQNVLQTVYQRSFNVCQLTLYMFSVPFVCLAMGAKWLWHRLNTCGSEAPKHKDRDLDQVVILEQKFHRWEANRRMAWMMAVLYARTDCLHSAKMKVYKLAPPEEGTDKEHVYRQSLDPEYTYIKNI